MDDHLIALLPLGVRSSGLDDTGPVAAWDEVMFGGAGVVGAVVGDEDVAVVEGDGVYANEGLLGARLRDWGGEDG